VSLLSGYRSRGSRERPTSSALVRYDRYRDDAGQAPVPGRCIATALLSWAWVSWHTRFVQWRATCASSHLARSLPSRGLAVPEQEAVARWSVQSPFEVTVAIRSTRGATLGASRMGCLEDHLLLRYEIEDVIDPQRRGALSMSVTGRSRHLGHCLAGIPDHSHAG
jgi:hypothetical protein